jgi:hypothetical protein
MLLSKRTSIQTSTTWYNGNFAQFACENETSYILLIFHLTGSVLLVRLPRNSTLKIQSFVSPIHFSLYATYVDRDVFLIHYCKQDTRLIHATSQIPHRYIPIVRLPSRLGFQDEQSI